MMKGKGFQSLWNSIKNDTTENDMTGQAKVIVHDLGGDTELTFMGVPAAWAVRYAYAEKDSRLSELYSLRENDASEDEVNIRFPVVRGPRTVACGDFVALEDEE